MRRFAHTLLCFSVLILLAACGNDATPIPISAVTQEATEQVTAAISSAADAPIPATARTRYEGIIQLASAEGYPQLGSPNAPAQMRLYAGFDSIGSRDLYNSVFVPLLTNIRAGEVHVTFVPLYEGNLENVAAATRNALCAAEQGAFWAMHDTFFNWNEAFGANAFTAERLDAAVNALVPDRAAWEACISSDRPDRTLSAARSETFTLQGFTSPPAVYINGSPVAPDVISISGAVEAARNAAQQAAINPTTAPDVASTQAVSAPTDDPLTPAAPVTEAPTQPAIITWTPSPGPSPTPEPTNTPIVFDPNAQIPPPLEIALPDTWQVGYGVVPLDRQIPFAIYTGPVTGGKGTIILLWGFANIIPPLGSNPFDQASLTSSTDIYSEGILLFRQAVTEPDCQRIGTDVVREYTVGGRLAYGTEITILDCPTTPDARGWFAGLQAEGMNFVFYNYVEPLEAVDGARAELQAILDTITFVPIVSVTATNTP